MEMVIRRANAAAPRQPIRCAGSVMFFFSSRRRHTRCSRDWNSDVCSSDLAKQRARLDWLGAPDSPAVTDDRTVRSAAPMGFHVAACRGGFCRLQMADVVGSSDSRPSCEQLETKHRLSLAMARHGCVRVLRCWVGKAKHSATRMVQGDWYDSGRG